MSKRIGIIAVLVLVLVLGMSSMALAASNVDYSGSPTDGVNDFAATKGFTNDGKAGYPNEIYLPNEGTPADYRIHSNYAATTDACASCHSTHTAVGEALLQWGTVYDTCMACHDGSVSTTYDVKGGQIANTGMPTFGGVFGDAYTDPANPKSLSNHNATGAMSIYAAPGGPGTPGVEASANWDIEFGCQSCHSPHGMGGNARILNPDVNGAAQAIYDKGAYNADATLLAPWTDSAKMTKIAVDGNNIGGSKNVPLLKAADGTYYTNWRNVQKVTKTGTPKVVTAVATDPSVKDQWLWSARPYKSNVKVYKNNTPLTLDTDYKLDNTGGFTKITFTSAPSDSDVLTADFVPAIKVQMNITNYLQGTENVAQISGLNNFCGACHTDYNTAAVDGPHATLNGTFTEAYRHKVGFDRASSATALGKLNMKLESGLVTCETCHTAHGVDSDFWATSIAKANGGTLPAGFETANLTEIAGSSALKRLPNMGTCEACHAKGLANQGYAALSGAVSTQVANVATSNVSGGGFAGQAACASCHGDIHKEYNKTWHAEMSRPGLSPETLADIQKPANATLINTLLPGFIAEAVKANVETAKVGYDEKGTPLLEPAAWAGKGVVADNIRVWTTGTEYGQEIMARGDFVGAPAGSEKNWYIVLYKQGTAYTPVAPLNADGSITAAGLISDEYACANTGCHTTGVNVNGGYQGDNVPLTSSAAYTTGWLEKVAAGQKPDFELGITCEACHGQGGNHVKAPSSKNIVNPATYTLAQQTAGTKSTYDAGTGKWTAAANRFLNTAAGAKSCGLCHSGKHQGDFFSTQTLKDFGGASIKTVNPGKMYTNDAVSCVTCHDSHSDAVKGQLTAKSGEQLCASCHGADLAVAMPAYPRSSVLHQHDFAAGKN